MKKASRTSLRSVSQWNDPERVEQLVSLAKDGVTYKDIAAQLNTTATSVRGKLAQMGVQKTKWFKPAPVPAKPKPRALSSAAKANIQSWEARNPNRITIRKFSWESAS